MSASRNSSSAPGDWPSLGGSSARSEQVGSPRAVGLSPAFSQAGSMLGSIKTEPGLEVLREGTRAEFSSRELQESSDQLEQARREHQTLSNMLETDRLREEIRQMAKKRREQAKKNRLAARRAITAACSQEPERAREPSVEPEGAQQPAGRPETECEEQELPEAQEPTLLLPSPATPPEAQNQASGGTIIRTRLSRDFVLTFHDRGVVPDSVEEPQEEEEVEEGDQEVREASEAPEDEEADGDQEEDDRDPSQRLRGHPPTFFSAPHTLEDRELTEPPSPRDSRSMDPDYNPGQSESARIMRKRKRYMMAGGNGEGLKRSRRGE